MTHLQNQPSRRFKESKTKQKNDNNGNGNGNDHKERGKSRIRHCLKKNTETATTTTERRISFDTQVMPLPSEMTRITKWNENVHKLKCQIFVQSVLLL